MKITKWDWFFIGWAAGWTIGYRWDMSWLALVTVWGFGFLFNLGKSR